MAKIKIHELAKKTGFTNKEIIEKANELGFNVKSHMSALEEEQAQKVEAKLNKESNKEKTNAKKEQKNEKGKEKKKENAPVIIRREVIVSENQDDEEKEKKKE